MGTTTLHAILDEMASNIRGATPTSRTDIPFVLHDLDDPLIGDGGVAERFPESALRRFDIADAGVFDGHDVDNTLVVHEEATAEIAVAYPHRWGLYGGGRRNRLEMERVIEEDRVKLNDTIGIRGTGNYTNGTPIEFTSRVDPGDNVSFLMIEVTVHFARSV